MLAMLLLLAPAHAAAGPLESHSAVVVAIDAENGILIIDEVGPWHGEPRLTMLTRRTIRLRPATEYALWEGGRLTALVVIVTEAVSDA